MNVLVILGHPNNKSFNHAIAETCKKQLAENGHQTFFHDLYEEKFDPIHMNLTHGTNNQIKIHCEHLTTSDAIIVIHPNWWGQPPAIIKGWMEQILLPSVAYTFKPNNNGDDLPVGLLKADVALVVTTSNTPNNFENDVLETIWKKNVFNICGINQVERVNFGMVKKSSHSQRSQWLLELKQVINTLFPTL